MTIDEILKKVNISRYTSCISNYKLSHDLKKRLSNINNFVVHNIEENLNSCVLDSAQNRHSVSAF